MIYSYLDIYTKLFNDYYDFIKDNATFNVKVSKKAPPSESEFPVITMKEVLNINSGRSLDGFELNDLVAYQVDIYTKDFSDNSGQHYSAEIQQELKMLTFEFFYRKGFKRTDYTNWEDNNLIYDRTTSIFQGNVQSWDKSIV